MSNCFQIFCVKSDHEIKGKRDEAMESCSVCREDRDDGGDGK